MTDAPELKPCPFCGSSNLKSGGDDKIVGTWCLDCQAVGPNQYGRHEWNTRADLAKPRVKPLVWDGPNCGIWDAGKRFHSDCAAYRIIWDLGRNETYTAYFGNNRLGTFDTLEDAKAAAQADYEARVLACLEGCGDE